jgi:tetratricopeptide (TPR) repeat protein
LKTVAIVMGVSNYQDSSFSQIPGARSDAERFASALTSWGVSNESIHLMLDEEVTKSNAIRTFFHCRSNFDKDAKLIFYFAGHGIRDNLVHQTTPESSLALYDTHFEDPLFTGLRLIELMQLARTLKPAQVFLFIDACSLRLNHIENPLTEEENFTTANSNGLFCLLSSGIHKSYEDGKLKYGYFTDALLKSISELRHHPYSSCHDIVRKVSKTLQEQKLPPPEVYHIGFEGMWPLEKGHSLDIEAEEKCSHPFGHRHEAIAKLQDHLVASPDPLIWMWGEKGIGKSFIAEKLCRRNGCIFYASIPNISVSYSGITQLLVEQIRNQKSEIFSNRPFDCSLSNTLNHISLLKPGSILILDQLDRLLLADLEAMISEIDETSISCVLVSRYPCPKDFFKNRRSSLIDFRASSLHLDEIEHIVSTTGLDSSFSNVLLNASKGNVLKVRQMLVNLSNVDIPCEEEVIGGYIKTMSAVVACGGFLDGLLFCKVFKIKSQILMTLERLGLISYTKEGCLPHDELIEMVEEGNWPLDLEKACHYWNLQVHHTPYHPLACRSMVLMASQIESCSHLKYALTRCLDVLNVRDSVSFLLDLVQIFKKERWEKLLIKAADYLINHEEYHMAGEVLKELCHSQDPRINKYACLNNAIRLVWLGRAEECINLHTEILAKWRSFSYQRHLNNVLGFSHFILGNLEQAREVFQATIKRTGIKGERGAGIAEFMAGLIMNYRGESLSKSKELMERSLQIFESQRDHLWIAIGLNGLADIPYRLNHWHQSFYYLNKALESLEPLKNRTFWLLTIRNMARVYLRLDPEHQELSNLVFSMENFLKETRGLEETWVTIWIQNTLATLYAHWNEVHKLKVMMQEVAPKTTKYQGVHIFTLSNLGHLASLLEDEKKAEDYYQQAYTLAIRTKNLFALQEIKQDIISCTCKR